MSTLIELILDPEPASARSARRAVESALRGEGMADDIVETAMLLVSEVVTNAVLHAGTQVTLRCDADGGGARIEVADESPVRPSARAHLEDATTGRGMRLVHELAADHGVHLRDGGKVVWFVVGDRHGSGVEDADQMPGTYTVRFVDMHVPMTRASLAYGEAVMREMALRAVGSHREVGERWQPPRFSLGPLLEALEQAANDGVTVVTADVRFPLSAKELSLERLGLVEEGHELAREGRLLAVAAIPEVMQCRRWVYRQIFQQADGAEPERWDLQEDLSEADVVLGLDDLTVLDASYPVVVADRHNRILFVNEPARVLLRQDDSVVGRRLTAVIPTDWRMAHLAGFARFQLTGESKIVGTPVTVPALRGDGTTVEVELLIEPVAPPAGPMFRASLRLLSPDSE